MHETRQIVHVIDDIETVRNALCRMVQAFPHDYEARGYVSAHDFLQACSTETAGVVLLDVQMPEMSGLELLQHLRDRSIRVAAIMISGVSQIPDCVTAMKNGAIDFLEKPIERDVLEQSIADGFEYLERQPRDPKFDVETLKRMDDLTDQERIVMNGIVDGKPNKQIATELDMSVRTVQFRRSSLMKKLGVDTRAELIAFVLTANSQT